MIFEVFLLCETRVTMFEVITLRVVEYCACSERPVYHVSSACFAITMSCGLSSNALSHLDISPPSTLSEGVTVPGARRRTFSYLLVLLFPLNFQHSQPLYSLVHHSFPVLITLSCSNSRRYSPVY
jgi:hypothetical protein